MMFSLAGAHRLVTWANAEAERRRTYEQQAEPAWTVFEEFAERRDRLLREAERLEAVCREREVAALRERANAYLALIQARQGGL
jgi:hypothetical protein